MAVKKKAAPKKKVNKSLTPNINKNVASKQPLSTLPTPCIDKNENIVVKKSDMIKALNYFGFNEPDLKDWSIDGEFLNFETLSGHKNSISIYKLL